MLIIRTTRPNLESFRRKSLKPMERSKLKNILKAKLLVEEVLPNATK